MTQYTTKDKYLVTFVPETEELSPGGLIIPGEARRNALVRSQVLVVPQDINDAKPDAQVGDFIIFPRRGGSEVEIDKVMYMLVAGNNVILIERDNEKVLEEPYRDGEVE